MARSSLFTLPPSLNDDILSPFPEDEGSTVSARVTASGGETAFASVKLSVSADEQGAITSSATAVAEVDDTKVTTTASADAIGETGSTSLDVAAGIEEQDGETVAVGSATAEAEAEAEEGGTATTTVSTDAEATGFDPEEIAKEQSPAGGETSETGEEPIAESFTYLEAVPVADVETDALQVTLADEQSDTWWSDVDW
jgi:hypothetical protein